MLKYADLKVWAIMAVAISILAYHCVSVLILVKYFQKKEIFG